MNSILTYVATNINILRHLIIDENDNPNTHNKRVKIGNKSTHITMKYRVACLKDLGDNKFEWVQTQTN